MIIKKASRLPPLSQTLVPARTDDVLELDEMWSFVRFRKNKRWVWLAQCRRTRQIVAYIVAYAVGDRSEATCRLLWERVPASYKRGLLYTDFWSAYAEALPVGQHRAAGKGAGQTCHPNKASHRALQRHSAPATSAVRAADTLVLEERRDARDLPAFVLAPA